MPARGGGDDLTCVDPPVSRLRLGEAITVENLADAGAPSTADARQRRMA